MEHRRRAIFAVVLILAALALACPAPATFNPAGKQAFLQLQVVDRLQELQNAAVLANATLDAKTGKPLIPEATMLRIVRFTVDVGTALHERPPGWQSTVRAFLATLTAGLSPGEAARLSPYLAALQVTFDALEAQP